MEADSGSNGISADVAVEESALTAKDANESSSRVQNDGESSRTESPLKNGSEEHETASNSDPIPDTQQLDQVQGQEATTTDEVEQQTVAIVAESEKEEAVGEHQAAEATESGQKAESSCPEQQSEAANGDGGSDQAQEAPPALSSDVVVQMSEVKTTAAEDSTEVAETTKAEASKGEGDCEGDGEGGEKTEPDEGTTPQTEEADAAKPQLEENSTSEGDILQGADSTKSQEATAVVEGSKTHETPTAPIVEVAAKAEPSPKDGRKAKEAKKAQTMPTTTVAKPKLSGCAAPASSRPAKAAGQRAATAKAATAAPPEEAGAAAADDASSVKPKKPPPAKRPTAIPVVSKAEPEAGKEVAAAAASSEKPRRTMAARTPTSTSSGGGAVKDEDGKEAKAAKAAPTSRTSAASAAARRASASSKEEEEKAGSAEAAKQTTKKRLALRRSLTAEKASTSAAAARASERSAAAAHHRGNSATEAPAGRARAAPPPRRATVGDAAAATSASAAVASAAAASPPPSQPSQPQPPPLQPASASASVDSVQEALHRSNSSQLSKAESGGSGDVFPDGGSGSGTSKLRTPSRVNRVTQRTPDCAELQHVTKVTPMPETRGVEIKQTAASRGRLQKLQEEANRALEASNENQYQTPLQRKETEVKELRRLLHEAYQAITEREEEIEAAARAKAQEIGDAVRDKEEDIAELQAEVEQLSLDYQALTALHGEVKRREEELEREVGKLRQEMEDREKRHQEYYLEMYRKGQESAKFERQDELEKLAVQEPDKVSMEELLEKLELTQQDLHKWQTLKLMETYSESEQPTTEADAKLRFLRDSMFHYLTEKDRDHGLQHLTAIIGIFNFTEVQMATIMKCLSERKKKGKI